MSLKQFTTILRQFNRDLGSRHTNHFLGNRRLLHTFNLHSLKTSRGSHLFRTPYSNHLHTSYSHYFSILSHLIHRHYQSTSHHQQHRPHQSSSFYNLYGNNRHRPTSHHSHPPFHHIFKRFASMDVSKDYYQLLGVKKNSTKKEIRSSYLKLAKKWHPDLHKNETDKKNARNKFM